MIERTGVCVVLGCAAVVCSGATAFAQAPDRSWQREYAGPAGFYNNVKSVATDADGNVYVTGESATGTGSAFATVKYSASGDQLWAARYVNLATGSDRPVAVRVAPDGNPIVAGTSDGQGTFGDYLVIKYDKNTGEEIWSERYDGPGHNLDGLTAMALDDAGDVYVTGQSWSGVDYDYVTLKLSGKTGDVIWNASQNGVKGSPDGINDAALAIATGPGGVCYVTGWVQIGFDSSEEINLYAYGTVKYDAKGNTAWFVVSGDAANTGQAIGVVVGPDGNPVVTGGSVGGAKTIKYNQVDGELIWISGYDGPAGAGATPYAMAMQPDGNIAITGGVCLSSPLCLESIGTFILRGSDGALLAEDAYRDDHKNLAGTTARGISVGPDGSIYVAGTSIFFSGAPHASEQVIVAYSPTGERLWVDSFVPKGFVAGEGFATAVDPLGNVIFGATSRSAPGISSFVTVKYGNACAADFNRDGVVNSQDFFDFLADFFENLPSADFNNDAAVNSQDFFDFLTAFFEGC